MACLCNLCAHLLCCKAVFTAPPCAYVTFKATKGRFKMSLSNSPTRYGAVTKTFHWLTAIGIVAMIPLGIMASDAPYDTAEALARKAQLFSVHKTLGVFLFFLALARILWALSQPKPVPLHPERRLETLLAEVVHWLLYGALVVVPLSGWVHHAATTGFAPIWWPFGQSLPFVPKDQALADLAAGLHIVFERVLILSLLLHIAGALKHAVWDRDATLRRMLPGRTEAGVAKPARSHLSAPLLSLLAWAAAIGLGAGFGAFSHESASTRTAALEEVSSDWTVTEGTLALTIRQFGSEVSGQFNDWTAAITFDNSPQPGPLGEVDVVVSIPSLSLGTVSAQAMGPDFFDADRFATARYSAKILRGADGYIADGTLTIRDVTLPVSFPFQMVVTEEDADMEARLTLDRRDFGIGLNMGDENQLGFDVVLRVTLKARRAAD